MQIKPALIMDLDGTVRRTKSGKPFSENAMDCELMPGIADVIWFYKRTGGWLVVAVSNQGGVAHGFKSINEVKAENIYMLSLFGRTHPFDIINFCPFDPAGK